MRKYKQFIIGFIVGAMLFSIIPLSAAIEEFICYRADYKVMVNGVEYISENLPILNYKGNTYAPFRSILEKAGLNVNWNAELRQAEVTSPKVEEGNKVSIAAMEFDPVTGLPIGAEYIDHNYNGTTLKAINYNSKTYISESDLRRYYNIEYIGKGIFTNKISKKSVTIDLTNGFPVKAVMYNDISLFSSIIGE